MGCSNCASGSGKPKGCQSNGGCSTSGCNKLTVFDWLSNIQDPINEAKDSIAEVQFKNGRKEYFKDTRKQSYTLGNTVVVEAQVGHDIGVVSLAGELVRVQMKAKKIDENLELKKIYRRATKRDVEQWELAKSKEDKTKSKSREVVNRLSLKMKLSDVEYQGDGSKAIFYYTAEERIDFRQLIKELAAAFSIRIEMRQVGFRQEASRLGGIGSCGRELCCSTWLTNFKKINISAARYQQLSLNPQALSGQCGKLKCCLNYELSSYLDALKKFPKTNKSLQTKAGEALFVKMDIFKEHLWYIYSHDKSKIYKLSLESVQEIINKSTTDQLASSLEDYELVEKIENKAVFENVVGQDSLTRFDKPGGKKRKKRKKSRKRN